MDESGDSFDFCIGENDARKVGPETKSGIKEEIKEVRHLHLRNNSKNEIIRPDLRPKKPIQNLEVI